MSRATLRKFLTTLQKELYGSSREFRKEADRKEMSFTFNANDFGKEIENEFKFRGLEREFNFKKIQNHIKTGSRTVLEACRAQAKQFKGTRGVLISSNQHFIRVTLYVEKNPRTDKNFVNFTKLKTVYRDSVNTFVLALNEQLKVSTRGAKKLTKTRQKYNKVDHSKTFITTDTEIDAGSDLIEGGHAGKEGIFESRVRDALDTALNKNVSKSESKRQDVMGDMDTLGLDFGFVRDDTSDKHSIFAQSRVENQKTGLLSAEDKKRLNKQITAALIRLDDKTPIADLKGSPSIRQIKEQNVEFVLLAPFKTKKNIKVTTTIKKPVLKKRASTVKASKHKTKKVKSKVAKFRIPLMKQTKRATSRNGNAIASNPLAMVAAINKKLPETVLKNMNLPALQSNSGRFAASTRVTDVMQTPQGFPSFGYTYEKDPYQVFEMGAGAPPWATPGRDPRKIIDRSIREIAAQFAIGRFYTRRA